MSIGAELSVAVGPLGRTGAGNVSVAAEGVAHAYSCELPLSGIVFVRIFTSHNRTSGSGPGIVLSITGRLAWGRLGSEGLKLLRVGSARVPLTQPNLTPPARFDPTGEQPCCLVPGMRVESRAPLLPPPAKGGARGGCTR